MKAIQNQAGFEKSLKSVVTRTNNIRTDIQALLVFAFAQFSQHGNAGFLERVLITIKPLKTVRTATMESFVFHYANVEWVGKGKDKRLKKTKGEALRCDFNGELWYEHDNEGVDAPALKVLARYNSLVQALDKAAKGECSYASDEDAEFASILTAALEDARVNFEIAQELKNQEAA